MNIVFNQAIFALEYLTCQVIIYLRKWSVSLHIILTFRRQVFQSGVFHQNRHSHSQVPLNVNYCQNNVKSVRKKQICQQYPNILASVFSIFLKSGLFSGSSSQQFFTSRYTQKEEGMDQLRGWYPILLFSRMGVIETGAILKTSQL